MMSPSRLIIKVCGMREEQNISDLEKLDIDWMGMIFWSGSKRYVSRPPSRLPQRVKKVGVFVDASLDDIRQHVSDYQLDIIQLHGHETPDYFLFDTKGKIVGGNGEKFDWTVLTAYEGATPFLLSGGIGPDDVQKVKQFHHHKCIGIDLNSRFESAPGLKDIVQLQTFIKQIRL